MKKLWAKSEPFHPLYAHMIDAGMVSLALLKTTAFQSTIKQFSEAAECPVDIAPAWLAYLVAMHDIGKCHIDFQAKGPSELIKPIEGMGLRCVMQYPGFRHEAMSAFWLLDFFRSSMGWERKEAVTVSQAIRGHHGNFGVDDPANETDQIKTQWGPLRENLEIQMRKVFVPEAWSPQFEDHSIVGILLSGLLVLSDWIASNSELFLMETGKEDPVSYAEKSKRRAVEAVKKLGLDSSIPWMQKSGFKEFWPELEAPRPLQKSCEELLFQGKLPPGLVIIEAPMGEGKTEAAIYIASRWLAQTGKAGIYIALPTAATSNQMYSRFKKFLEHHDRKALRGVKLVHGMSWLLDDETPNTCPTLDGSSEEEPALALEWFQPKKRSLLASLGVGTIDQALMSVLHVKHGFLRLFGLAGKVLVIDEVHAYDAYMSKILVLLLKWAGTMKIPVIMLSATLPKKRRRALLTAYSKKEAAPEASEKKNAYPLMTILSHKGETQEFPVEGSAMQSTVSVMKHHGLLGKSEEIARLVASRIKNGGCFCVIANTVNSAQEIFKKIQATLEKTQENDFELLLFHARFRAERRQEIENQALEWFDKRSLLPEGHPDRTERPKKAIIVATQVVEQSLDLDFDEMFSEIAPIDLLLQRTGRLHRHKRPQRPTGNEARFHLFMPEENERPSFGSVEKIYSRFILLKTMAVLEKINHLELPTDIRELIEKVYDDPPSIPMDTTVSDEPDFIQSLEKMKEETENEEDQAKKYLIPMPKSKAFEIARVPGSPYDESDEGSSSYFYAKTRLGDETKQILVLEEDDFVSEMKVKDPPALHLKKQIFMKTANIPRWWLANLEQPVLEEAPSWLRGTTVLRLKGTEYEGSDKNGKKFVIRDDEKLGLIRFAKEGK
ncbi:MAG: CRISPR-associated helicase Cas3' [bacterium]